MRRFFSVLVVLGIVAAGSSVVRAQPLYDTPVYNPETRSYFELVKVTKGYSIRGANIPAITWSNARKLARSRFYKGVRGRLAVVKSQSVNDFLRQTFKPDEKTWIGLRYWCAYNKLQWVTGEFHPLTAYANWDRIWRHDGGTYGGNKEPTCNEFFNYWPVHYWPVQNGFRWNANGTHKEFKAFFVEYPTGKP